MQSVDVPVYHLWQHRAMDSFHDPQPIRSLPVSDSRSIETQTSTLLVSVAESSASIFLCLRLHKKDASLSYG